MVIATKVRDAGGKSTSLATTVPKPIVEIFNIKKGSKLIWTLTKTGAHVSKAEDVSQAET